MKEKLGQLERTIGYTFQDRALMTLAVTHSSYANEHRQKEKQHNERLEFLGDAVLEIVSSEYLYRTYPEKPEGALSKMRASMVCEPTLALCAQELHLPSYLLLGRGEEQNGGRMRDSIVSDALEALIGAIYLDGGFDAAKAFIDEHILKDIEKKKLFQDSKTNLQEILQAHDLVPEYVLTGEEGPAHSKLFYVTVQSGGVRLGSGAGHSKKAAEQQAAFAAIGRLGGGDVMEILAQERAAEED